MDIYLINGGPGGSYFKDHLPKACCLCDLDEFRYLAEAFGDRFRIYQHVDTLALWRTAMSDGLKVLLPVTGDFVCVTCEETDSVPSPGAERDETLVVYDKSGLLVRRPEPRGD